MTDLTFQLADERQLAYAFYGPEHGQPVLYFHGTPSSRLEPLLTTVYGIDLNGLLQQYNIRLIAVDRPGMGLSSFHEGRTMTSFAGDVQQLLQFLQIDTCQLLCWSGGGPYALAMAHLYPDAIKNVSIIAGFSTSFGEEEVYAKMGWNKMYFNTARKAPLLLRGSLELMKKVKISSPISQKLYDLSNVDYALMKDVNKFNQLMAVTTKEACTKSTDGPIQEAQLYFSAYPYSLKGIQVPVHFWWGTEDNVVTYIHAKNMERGLPNVTPHYKKGEGHLSVYVHCFEEVLQLMATI
jgi:pimeloyl-ACP methyl ester carboxylesterase